MEGKANITVENILRQKAEELLDKKSINTDKHYTDIEIFKLVHELDVHQIELEMQNDELLLAKIKAETNAEKYTNLYDFAPSGYFTLSNKGEIIELNFIGATLLGKERSLLQNKRFALYVADESKTIFNLFLEELFESKTRQACEIMLSNTSEIPTYVFLSGIVSDNDNQCVITMHDISQCKKAEENLKKSQLLLQSTLESQVDTLIFSIDKNYNYLSFNKAHSDVMKIFYNTDIKVGMNILDCISSIEDRKAAKQNYDRALRGETHSNIRFFGDVEKAHFESFFNPIVDVNHRIIGATGLARNITKRIQNQENLRISEEKYRTLFESNRDSITIFRLDKQGKPGNFIEANPATKSILGYTKKDLLELSVRDIEIVSDKNREFLIAILLSKGRVDFETIVTNKKGDHRYVEVESIVVNYLNEPAVMNITRDITERKQNEENTRKAQENLATILKAIPDLLFEVDLEGRIYYYQGYRDELLYVPENEFLDKKFHDIIPFEAANICFEAMHEALLKGWSSGKQYSLNLPKGKSWFELSVSPLKETGSTDQHFIMLSRDITIRKEVEEQLRIEKERIRTILEMVGTPIFLKDNDHKITYANSSFYNLFGLDEKSVIGKTLAENVPKNEQEHFLKIDRNVLDTGIPDFREEKLTVKGVEHTIITNKTRFIDESGNKSLVGCIHDITERKLAECALENEKRRLAVILIGTGAGTWEWNIQTGATIFNEQWAKIIGYTLEEIAPVTIETWRRFTHPDDLKHSEEILEKYLRGNQDHYECELRMKHKNGDWIWVLDRGKINEWDLDGKPLYMSGTHLDITERKLAESALLYNMSLTEATLDSVQNGILAVSLMGNIIKANAKFAEMWKIPYKILNSTNHKILLDFVFEQLINPEEFIDKVTQLYAKPEAKSIDILYFKDGRIFERVSKPMYVEGKTMGRVWSFLDITEQKLSEEKLIASENFLNQTQSIANLGSYSLDFSTGKWTSSTVLDQIFGIDESYDKTAEGWQKILHPDWRTIMNDYLNNEVVGKKIDFNKEYKISKVDNKEERWVHGMGEITFDNEGQPLRLIGSIQDITERKTAEEQVFQERQLLRTIIDNIPDSIYAKDIDSCLTLANKKDLQLMGVKSEEEVLGKNDFDFYPKALANTFFADDQAVMQADKAIINKEELIIDENGLKQWILTSKLPLKNNDNTVIGLVGIGHNITEHKQSEEAIRLREQNYRTLFDTSTDSIFIHDINTGTILDVNETMLKTFGYLSKKEIIGDTIEKLSLNTKPYTAKVALNYFQKTIKEGKQVFEWIARKKDGTIFWNEMILKVITIDGKERILAVGRNITERKLTEEKLKLSSEKFQDLVNSTGGIVWEADANTFDFVYVSKQAERLLGFSVEEWYAEGFWVNHLHPDDKDKAISYCVTQTKKMEAHDFTYRFICKKGKTIWLRDIVNVVVEDGKPRWIRGVMFDITHLKETNLLLKESEEKYRGLVENSPDGIVLYVEDKIAFINDEGIRMLGAKNIEEIIGKSVLEFVHPDSLESIIQRMKEVTRDKSASAIVEEKFIKIDGASFDVEIKAIPTLYEHKPAVQVIVHDITLRKQAAQELNKINRVYALISQINNLILRTHNREELFQEICNIAVNFGKFRMSWIGLLNDNHKIITAAFAGYEKGYFTESNVTTILDVPEGRGPTGIALREARTVICNDIANDPIMKPWRKDALERGYSSVISIPIIVRNKKIGAYNLYSEETNFFSSEEEISLLEKIILNIAFALESILIEEDRKRTEEKIRQLSQAVEQSPVTIVITNIKGEIEYVNSKFVETTGYTVDEVIGQNPRILKSGHTSSEEYKDLWKSVATGKEWHGEFHNKRKDGTLFWESATISPILNAEGKTTHYIAIKEDITRRKKVEKELVISKERAEESDRLKLAFLANMSHEIRTPMNGILGFTELLKEPKLSGAEQREYIDIIEKSGKRMLNIINDIISISKVESGQIEISISETNINEQINYIHTFFKPEAKQKGIQLYITKELPSKYNLIKTDREKLYAILTNLVKNALKFTNEGSIEFGCEKKGDTIQCFVKDSGIGISNSQKNIIFERFRQANETISRSHEGSGLGLAISKAYVDILGGKIWVESEEGKGSTFYFTIPYQSESEPKEKMVPTKVISEIKQENKINDLKVLIVEDDAISKLLITIAVKPFSKEILKVSTGIEAIEACYNNPDINLVMMDINMPEMGGYEATKQIREFNKDLVIIAQTANGMQSDREEAITAGCTDYISKPINITDLSELIQKYFKK